MTGTVILAENLSKRYGEKRGLADLNMQVYAGEVFGFLGPNGAGKTTTIRLLLDLIRPTSGRVEVFGLDPRLGGPGLRSRIGYLPGELAMESRQSAAELLVFLGQLRGGVERSRIGELADRLGLDLSMRIKGLSKGNRQKIGLVQAFMHRPDLLILDEPTSGLDPLLQQEFLAMVRETRAAGQTVFMSSHILSEVEDVADRVGIIRDGWLVTVSDVDSLREHAPRRVEIRFADAIQSAEFSGIPGVRHLEVEGTMVRCTIDGPADALIKAAARHTVVSVLAEEPDLEEIFLTHYKEEAHVT